MKQCCKPLPFGAYTGLASIHCYGFPWDVEEREPFHTQGFVHILKTFLLGVLTFMSYPAGLSHSKRKMVNADT